MKELNILDLKKKLSFKNYVGSKIIKCAPCTYGYYKDIKYGDTEFKSNIEDTETGYIVIYPPVNEESKPHISWTPSVVFNECYREISKTELNLIL